MRIRIQNTIPPSPSWNTKKQCCGTGAGSRRSRNSIAYRSRSCNYELRLRILIFFFIKDLKKFCWKNIQFYNFNFIHLIKSAEKSFFRLIRQSRRWIQSRNSDLWLRGAGVKNNIFGSATLLRRPEFLVGRYLFGFRSVWIRKTAASGSA
jgi:hypothetical protein